MSFASTVPFTSFWSQSWSVPLRAACVWLRRTPPPVVPFTPNRLAPGWLRPLCLQREVGQAVGARLTWMRAHPDQAGYLYPTDSIPCWSRDAWIPYERGALRVWTDEWLLVLFQMEVERLLRIVQTPPALLGEEVWTRAALGACEHLAQLYREFRRRYQARPVRLFVRRVLRAYVCWECPREVA